MTPPRWVRDAHPDQYLAGRAAAWRQQRTRAARSLEECERECTANLFGAPKLAAWWAGYAVWLGEQLAAGVEVPHREPSR